MNPMDGGDLGCVVGAAFPTWAEQQILAWPTWSPGCGTFQDA